MPFFDRATFLFLKITISAIVHHRLLRPGNRPMAKPSKKSFRREAAVSPPAPEPARRVALRRATAAQRAAHSTHHRGNAGEPRDRSARRLRPVADRPAQRSDDRRAHDAGEFHRYRSFAPSQIPAFADAAPSRRITAPRRELPAPNAAPVEAEAKLFLAANP